MKTENYFTKTNNSKLNIFRLIITILFLFIFILIPVKAKGKPCTVLLGDFMVTLVNLGREGDIANLEFSITKVADSNSGCQSLAVFLIDDHENEYKGSLRIDVGGASDFILNTLPKSFTYVDMVSISIPEIAPIDKIRIGNMKEQDFKEIKTISPLFMKELGDFAITKGQSVTVGKWLSFTLKDIIPASRHWDLLIKIENKEYNPLNGSIRVAVQLNDGTISWSKLESEDIPSLSESLLKVILPISSWLKGGPPQPRVLLLEYNSNIPETKKVFKMFSITLDELPPLVGQGINEDLFVEAYKRNGDHKMIGDPLNLPHWFAGGDKAKDSNDILIQEFPSVSEFEKSAIIWNGQANKAYFLHGNILQEYLKIKGLNSSLGGPISDQVDIQSCFKTKGNYINLSEGMIVSHSDRIYTVSGEILNKWNQRNFAKSPLGFPISNGQPTTSGAVGFKTKGIIQKFEGGDIYYLTTGKYAGHVFEIHGPIHDFYTKEMQNNTGLLGFPMQDCSGSPEKNYGPYDFEGGYIATPDNRIFQAFGYEPGRIAFTSDRDGNAEVYVTDARGKKQVNITKNPANDYAPAWSPDGSQIAFVSDRARDGIDRIYLMNTDGTNQRLLVEGKDPSWFPNGSKIIYSKNGRIFTIKLDGTEEHKVIPDKKTANVMTNNKYLFKYSNRFPAVSPDGAKIAFSIGNREISGHPYNVYLMNIDGTNLNDPTDPRSHWYTGEYPFWFPDGQKIAFKSDNSRYIKLFRKTIMGGSIFISNIDAHKKATKLEVICYGKISLTPDGEAIIYTNEKQQICILNLRSKIIRKIAGEGRNLDPDWCKFIQ